MALKATDIPSTSNRTPQPALDAGSYPARLVGVAEIGQHAQEYKGEIKAPKKELRITYELLDEYLVNEDGEEDLEKPRWLSERFPFNPSNSEKAKSTIRYTALDQTLQYEWDWSKLLGTPCMLTIVQNPGKGKNAGRVFNKISGVSIMRPKEAAKARQLINPPYLFDFDMPTQESWEALPDWVKEECKKALDYKGSALETLLSGSTEETTVSGDDSEPQDDNW